jgi:hypothetical protein
MFLIRCALVLLFMSQLAASQTAKENVYACRKLDGAAGEEFFSSRSGLPLRQSWLKEPSPAFAPGEAAAAWTDDFLYVFARLKDGDIFNPVKVFNQPAYLEGDIFEILIRPVASDAYFEFHITPFGQVMQLRFPKASSLEEFRLSGSSQSIPEAFRHDERVLEVETKVRSEENRWTVVAKIPARVLSSKGRFAAGDRLLFSFCRYDHTQGQSEPVLSSTSDYTLRSFHRQGEWRTMEFVEKPD